MNRVLIKDDQRIENLIYELEDSKLFLIVKYQQPNDIERMLAMNKDNVKTQIVVNEQK